MILFDVKRKEVASNKTDTSLKKRDVEASSFSSYITQKNKTKLSENLVSLSILSIEFLKEFLKNLTFELYFSGKF